MDNTSYPKVLNINQDPARIDFYFIGVILVFFVFLLCGSYQRSVISVSAKYYKFEKVREVVAPFNGYIRYVTIDGDNIKAYFESEDIESYREKINRDNKAIFLFEVKRKYLFQKKERELKNIEKKIIFLESSRKLLNDKIKILEILIKERKNSLESFKKLIGGAISKSDFQLYYEKQEDLKISLFSYLQDLQILDESIYELKNKSYDDIELSIYDVNLKISELESNVDLLMHDIEKMSIRIDVDNSESKILKRISENMFFSKGERVFVFPKNKDISRIVSEISQSDYYRIDDKKCAVVTIPKYRFKESNKEELCSFKLMSEVIHDDSERGYKTIYYLVSTTLTEKFEDLLDGTDLKLSFRSKRLTMEGML